MRACGEGSVDFKAIETKCTLTPVLDPCFGRPKSIADLKNHNCIAYRQIKSGSLYRWELLSEGREIAIEGSGNTIVNNALYARELALAGIGLTYLAERGRYSVAYEARGAQYAGVPAPREASLGIFHMLTDRLALKGSFILGLNDGSPRTSVGLGVVYWPR